MTIRVRLAAWYALVGAATLVLLGIVVWLQYSSALRDSLGEVLQTQANATRELIEADPTEPPDVGSLERGLFIVVFDPPGAITFASPGAPTIGRPTPGFSSLPTGSPAPDELYAVSAVGGQTVVAGSSTGDIERNLASLVRTMALVGSVGAVVLVVGGWWLAGRALAPVSRMTAAADAIGSSDLDQRLEEPSSHDELAALARTLNRMLGRVEESAKRQRAFVAGASHDLRTPLASLRTELELALAEPTDRDGLLSAVEGAHADAVRLSELANGLLGLAAAEPDGRRIDRRPFALGPLVEESIDLARKGAGEREVSVVLRVPAGEVRADRARLQQALVNLLSNAIRFAPAGTVVELEATLDPNADRDPEPELGSRVLRVEVLDRGPGVAADLRGALFEPFVRSRTARSDGTGLGLATAAAAVRAHGGAIGYEDRPGGGARFWFWIPA